MNIAEKLEIYRSPVGFKIFLNLGTPYILYSKTSHLRWVRYNKEGYVLKSTYEKQRSRHPEYPPYEEIIPEVEKLVIKEML